jgi:hypothetical protein
MGVWLSISSLSCMRPAGESHGEERCKVI